MRGRRGWYPACFALLTVLLLSTVSSLVLAPLESRCGRLHQSPLAGGVLTLDEMRLALPAGASWRDLALRYDVAAGEALEVVLDRHGDDFQVLRLSREPMRPGGVFGFVGGEIATRRPFPAASSERAPDHGILRLHRAGGTIEASVDGTPLTTVPAASEPGETALALFPPWSPRLLARVDLREVVLADGTALGPTSSLFRRAQDQWWLWVALAAAASAPLALARRPLLARVFRNHAEAAPGQITVFLVWLAVLLGVGDAFMRVFRTGYMSPVGASQRDGVRAAMGVMVIWSLLFLWLRDRLLGRFPRLRGGFAMHGAWLVPMHVAATLAIAAVVGPVLGSDVIVPQVAREAPAPDTRVRVLCYGGSSTRGHPFPVDWPFTFPAWLERLLRADIDPRAVVWNLGMDSKRITDIDERVEGDLASFSATEVVLYSVVNNLELDPERFRAGVRRFLDSTMVRHRGPQVLLVEEQDFNFVYEWEALPPHYAILADVARERGAPLLDPTDAFRQRREEFLFMDRDGHLTKYGYHLLAKLVHGAMDSASQPPA